MYIIWNENFHQANGYSHAAAFNWIILVSVLLCIIYYDTSHQANEDTQSADLIAFLAQYVPDVQLVEAMGSEMTFMLPTHQGQLARFPEMFAHFDKQKYDLGVSSYGVSDTTLEEVIFLLFHIFLSKQ